MSTSALDLFRIDGKTAWVTGGTKGLGLVMADALCSVGAQVVVSSRSPGEASAVAADLAKKYGRKTLGLQSDATSAEAIAALVTRVEGELGGVDILVANAGTTVRKPTVDMPLSDWQHVVDMNLTSPFQCSKAVLPGMIKRNWGRIIYMSSIFGTVGMPGRPGYVATKGALVLLAKGQALEVAKNGITVNAICPGPFATPMNKALLEDPQKYAEFVAKIPMGRWGELHELPGAIVFLASNAGSYVTGTTITIDGGWTAQ